MRTGHLGGLLMGNPDFVSQILVQEWRSKILLECTADNDAHAYRQWFQEGQKKSGSIILQGNEEEEVGDIVALSGYSHVVCDNIITDYHGWVSRQARNRSWQGILCNHELSRKSAVLKER